MLELHRRTRLVAAVVAIVVVSTTAACGDTRGQSRAGVTGPAPSVITDEGVRNAPPPPQLPPAGGTFSDPVFGTTVLRVTDERDGPANQVPYSYWPTFSRDNRYVQISDTSGQAFLYDFDPGTFTIANRRPLWRTAPRGGVPFAEDAIWSAKNPNVIFGHSATRLWAYNVRTRRYSLLRDFATSVPMLWQMSRSTDDNVFCFTWRNAQSVNLGWLCWRRDTNTIWRRRDKNVDEIKVDKTGRYAHVALTTSGAGVIEGRVVDLRRRRIIANLRDDAPGLNPGHADMGRNLIVGAENWTNRLLARRLSTPRRFRTVLNLKGDWSQDTHLSLLADGDRWVLVSTYDGSGKPTPGRLHNEIFAVSVDGKQRYRRLAHHHSVVREYSDSPRANISRDGRFVAFTSNWGGTAQRDVFIVRVPPSTFTAP